MLEVVQEEKQQMSSSGRKRARRAPPRQPSRAARGYRRLCVVGPGEGFGADGRGGSTDPAERAVMLLKASKTISAEIAKKKPAAMIRVRAARREIEVTAGLNGGLNEMMRWCSITTLDIDLYNTSWRHGHEGGRWLADVLPQCPSLAHLNLVQPNLSKMEECRAVSIGDAEAGRLAGALPQCPRLAHLDLGGNYWIRDEGARRIVEVLPQCPSLAHLDLSRTCIGDERADRLAGVLPLCPSLVHLDHACVHVCVLARAIFVLARVCARMVGFTRAPPNPFIYKAYTNVCKSMRASTHLASTRVRRILAAMLRGCAC